MNNNCPFCNLSIEEFDDELFFKCEYCGCKLLYDKTNERFIDYNKEIGK